MAPPPAIFHPIVLPSTGVQPLPVGGAQPGPGLTWRQTILLPTLCHRLSLLDKEDPEIARKIYNPQIIGESQHHNKKV